MNVDPAPAAEDSADPVAAPAVRVRQAAMPFIMLTVLIDMVSIGLIIPVLPRLVGSFERSAGELAGAYALVAAAFGFANFLGSPVLGALSDRFGRRPVLLIGFSGLAFSFFATAASTALWMLVAIRLVSGALQANIAVANAYVSDITPPEDRARRFGMLGAMFGLGFILGPVTGGMLSGTDLRLPFWCAGGLAVCNWLYGFFVLPESLPPERRQAFSWARANPVGSLLQLSRMRHLAALLAVVALSAMAQFILQSTWALYTQIKFGWTSMQVGMSLGAVGVMSVIVQGALVGRMTRRLGAARVAVIGLASSAACYVAWGAATQGWMMVAVIAFNVFGFAAATALQSIVANTADPSAYGRTMGTVSGLSSLMAAIAPAIGPLLLKSVADAPRGDWRLGAPFYVCAALQAVAMAMTLVHIRRHRLAAPAAAS